MARFGSYGDTTGMVFVEQSEWEQATESNGLLPEIDLHVIAEDYQTERDTLIDGVMQDMHLPLEHDRVARAAMRRMLNTLFGPEH